MQVSSSYTLYVFTQWLITILKILKVKTSTSFCQLGTTKPLQCKSLFHTPACKLTKAVGKASTTIKRNPLPFFNPLTNQDENSPRCGTQQLPFRRGNLGNLQSFLLCQYYKSIMSSSISNSCLLFFAKKNGASFGNRPMPYKCCVMVLHGTVALHETILNFLHMF